MNKVDSAAGSLLVRRLELYGLLPDEDRAALFGIRADMRRLKAGEDFVREGATPEGVFVVVDGFACRYQLSYNGARHITAYLLPGDLCDLDIQLFSHMDHNIGALSACTVAQLTLATVQGLLGRPALARAMRLVTLAEVANLREWLVNVGTRQAPHRVAHLLCGLLARLRAVGLADADSFDFPLTQIDLADTMGMSAVHMNRALQELRKARLIELRRNRLTIFNPPELQAFAQFDQKNIQTLERTAA